MAVTKVDVLLRIRHLLNEPTAALWDDSVVYGLMQWYDEGAVRQHRIVLDMAEAAGLLGSVDNDYLRYFLAAPITGSLVAGTQDYALSASTSWWRYLARVYIGASPEITCEPRSILHDNIIRNFPQFGPTYQQPFYAVLPATSANTAKIRFYLLGNQTVPNDTRAYGIQYYRDVIATTSGATTVDLPDPYNEGPIAYACYQAMLRERTAANEFMQMFEDAARAILAPVTAKRAMSTSEAGVVAAPLSSAGPTSSAVAPKDGLG